MGQTVFWPKIGPITTDFDGNRGDRFPPMRPRILSGSRGPAGPKIEFLSWGGGGPMYAIVYPENMESIPCVLESLGSYSQLKAIFKTSVFTRDV